MAISTIIIGLMLVATGAFGFQSGHPDAATGHVSYTALIPAWVGIALCALGAVSLNEKMRKHAMHLAAMVGLLAAISDGMQLIKTFRDTTAPADVHQLKIESMGATFVLCLVFVALCVRSFIQARRNRAQD